MNTDMNISLSNEFLMNFFKLTIISKLSSVHNSRMYYSIKRRSIAIYSISRIPSNESMKFAKFITRI